MVYAKEIGLDFDVVSVCLARCSQGAYYVRICIRVRLGTSNNYAIYQTWLLVKKQYQKKSFYCDIKSIHTNG